MQHLDRQALGDPGLRDEVLRLYASMSRVYMGRIESSSSAPALIEHLHTLKSAAAGIGAWRIRDLAEQAEDELRSGAAIDPGRIGGIAAAVDECVSFIAVMLDDPAD